MSRPKILDELDQCVRAEDDEVVPDTIPVNADTLGGMPASHYASKADVGKAISEYVTTVLGTSY